MFGGRVHQRHWDNINAAIAAENVLYIAGHAPRNDPDHPFYPDTTGLYRRHPESTGCKGADAACLWAPYWQEDPEGLYTDYSGTSGSAPHVAAAIASVLSVFPDTHYTDLSRFTKACARKSGDGIEELLQQSGGLGVADFTCMGEVVESLTQLPSGGSANLTINGNAVTMSGRQLVAEFPVSSGVFSPVVAGYADKGRVMPTGGAVPAKRENGFSLYPVFTDETSSFVGVHRVGKFFTSVGVGTREDFYGYRSGHDSVFEAGVSVGHENAFLRFSRMHSDGGKLISSAEGQSYGFTVQQQFRLAEVPFIAAAHTDQFLGGKANIPSGSADLKEGGWNHRLNLSSAVALSDTAHLALSAEMHLPETGEDTALLAARFWWYF